MYRGSDSDFQRRRYPTKSRSIQLLLFYRFRIAILVKSNYGKIANQSKYKKKLSSILQITIAYKIKPKTRDIFRNLWFIWLNKVAINSLCPFL